MKIINSKKQVLILKVALVILLLFILLFLIHTIRNYTIITSLQNKILTYVNNSNYATKRVSMYDNNETITTTYYKKNNKILYIIEKEENGENSKISTYYDGKNKNTFIESENQKVAVINSEINVPDDGIYEYLYTSTVWGKLKLSIFSFIKSSKYNNISCYVFCSNGDNGERFEVYLDKSTGLFLKADSDSRTIEQIEYSFDNVNDSVFIEPDVEEYVVKNNLGNQW